MDRIQKNIQINEKYKKAEDYAKSLANIGKDTNWFESKLKYNGVYEQKRVRVLKEQEKENAVKELNQARRMRLKELYEADAECYKAELNQRGLRILKDRD
mmetsp:Transcript_11690/g.13476  ORF Transcript_11690/g.13476 Transcript_11690/m.13476 type:complete len:100 (-) Transcript_11690:54-353(-)